MTPLLEPIPADRNTVESIVSDKTRTPRMFDTIARRYDLLNHVLSGNVDRLWRRSLVAAARVREGDSVLDVATGTADVAVAFAGRTRARSITGIDLSPGMLEVASRKLARTPLAARIGLVEGDALELPFASGSFDAVTVAFGLRNLPDYPRGIAEMVRVLRPGGRLVVLEFLPPRGAALLAYRAYLATFLPLAGRLISGSGEAYGYLAASIRGFLAASEVERLMTRAGLARVESRRLTAGIAGLYRGEKS